MMSLKKQLCFQLIAAILLFPVAGQAAKVYKKETTEERRVRVGMCSQRCFLTEKRCKYTVAERIGSATDKKKDTKQCITKHDKCVKDCDVDLFPH